MITTSIIVLFGLGLAAAIVLSVASVVLRVEEDPRVEAVAEALPGANCGGCGYAGCEQYAKAVVENPDVAPDACCAGGSDVTAKVAELTGKSAGSGEPRVAFRRCDKVGGKVEMTFGYQGVLGCAAAKLLQNAPDACTYSCIGFGDCVRACPFDAMYLENNMVEVDPEKCTACGTCVQVCPNDILELIPLRARVQVFCSSMDKAKQVMEVCEVGCISCQKCVKKCPADVITMKDNRIYIDHQKCLEYGPSCEEVCSETCPRDILRRLKSQDQIAAMLGDQVSVTQPESSDEREQL
jgi:electron transport complex protein RnfB